MTYGKNINKYWRVIGPIAIIGSLFLIIQYANPVTFFVRLYALVVGILLTIIGYKQKWIKRNKLQTLFPILFVFFLYAAVPIFGIIVVILNI